MTNYFFIKYSFNFRLKISKEQNLESTLSLKKKKKLIDRADFSDNFLT